jgi:hypothetical protein
LDLARSRKVRGLFFAIVIEFVALHDDALEKIRQTAHSR